MTFDGTTLHCGYVSCLSDLGDCKLTSSNETNNVSIHVLGEHKSVDRNGKRWRCDFVYICRAAEL